MLIIVYWNGYVLNIYVDFIMCCYCLLKIDVFCSFVILSLFVIWGLFIDEFWLIWLYVGISEVVRYFRKNGVILFGVKEEIIKLLGKVDMYYFSLEYLFFIDFV